MSLLLRHAEWFVALSPAFGLLSMAPTAIVMALTDHSMVSQRQSLRVDADVDLSQFRP